MKKVISVEMGVTSPGTISDIKVYSDQRKCSSKGCKTRLSRYNPNAYCFAHLNSLTISLRVIKRSPHYMTVKKPKKKYKGRSLPRTDEEIVSLWQFNKTAGENAKTIGIGQSRAYEVARKHKLNYKKGSLFGRRRLKWPI